MTIDAGSYSVPSGVTALLIERVDKAPGRRHTQTWLAQRLSGADGFSGTWCSPGGKPNPDEPPLAALRRELREETSLDITEDRFEYAGMILIWKKGQQHPIGLYLVELEEDEIPARPDMESTTLSEWELFILREANELTLIPGTQAVLAVAMTKYGV